MHSPERGMNNPEIFLQFRQYRPIQIFPETVQHGFQLYSYTIFFHFLLFQDIIITTQLFFQGAFFAPQKTGLSVPIFFAARGKKGFPLQSPGAARGLAAGHKTPPENCFAIFHIRYAKPPRRPRRDQPARKPVTRTNNRTHRNFIIGIRERFDNIFTSKL
jgi:hypothetical protein